MTSKMLVKQPQLRWIGPTWPIGKQKKKEKHLHGRSTTKPTKNHRLLQESLRRARLNYN